ncbi:EFR1 family ferrodoxin [Vibrio salinus]|uniref:EFR1 family ferrodoxin n=1 Tax=Vibrio salinus TaxID=2899784 RepID=UPI001E2D7655|nr:EFR1 family ferrodoxin [Vibrio salinus]MCE0495964.1 EFR1 family ferrodoxin [Vibrio salinus]
MNINNVKLVYFSPTGTNEAILKSIAGGLAVDDVETVNLTRESSLEHETLEFNEDVVILAAPVYAGRIPLTAIERFMKIKANHSLAIVVVVYGNRAYDDALLELKDLAVDVGFRVIAGAAFIGEHSFSSGEFPVADNRPDDQDIREAINFGYRIKEKILTLDTIRDAKEFEVPGHYPYQERSPSMHISPVSNENCEGCGLCVELCPTSAIYIDDVAISDSEMCILCSACIKGCPEKARFWESDNILEKARYLTENCSERKEPEVFGL